MSTEIEIQWHIFFLREIKRSNFEVPRKIFFLYSVKRLHVDIYGNVNYNRSSGLISVERIPGCLICEDNARKFVTK